MISVSISSNFVEEPNFLCNFYSHHLVASFIGCLEGLALQSKTQTKFCLPDIETTKKTKLGSILKNPPIVIIEEGKPVQMIATTRVVLPHSYYTTKRFNQPNCRSTWNDIAKTYLCLFSTVQNKISI